MTMDTSGADPVMRAIMLILSQRNQSLYQPRTQLPSQMAGWAQDVGPQSQEMNSHRDDDARLAQKSLLVDDDAREVMRVWADQQPVQVSQGGQNWSVGAAQRAQQRHSAAAFRAWARRRPYSQRQDVWRGQPNQG